MEPGDLATRRGRLPGGEGYRALAAGSVLLYHVYVFAGSTAITLPGPGERVVIGMRYGLILFFALSGLLLYRPFAAALLRGEPQPSIAGFLRNRALRILPAYWVILLVSGLVFAAAITTFPLVGRPDDPLVLFADLVLLQNFWPDAALTGIGPAWSLAVEAMFYLALPLLAAGAAALATRLPATARGRLAAAWAPVALLFAVGLTTRVALAAGVGDGASWQLVARISLPAQADLFACGMTIALLRVLVEDGRLRLGGGARRVLAGSGAALLALIVMTTTFASVPAGQPLDTFAAVSLSLLLASVVLPVRPGRVVALLERRPMAWLGRVSFSVYLWHTPVIFLLVRWGLGAEDKPRLLLLFVVTTVVTLTLSALTYRFVERPALARKRPWARTAAGSVPQPPAPAVASAVAGTTLR